MEKKLTLVKCVECGATLNNLKCSYCGTDYSFSKDFTKEIENTQDPKLKGYYKLLDVAFNSGDYSESYNYANKILELEPDNTEIWGIKIYSSVYLMSVADFENGNGQVILNQLKNVDNYYKSKIGEIIFNYAVSFIKNEERTKLLTIYDTAKTSLQYVSNKEKARQTLYYAVSNRNPKFWDQFQHKSKILNEIKSLYQQTQKVSNSNNTGKQVMSNNNNNLKEAKNSFLMGILSIPGAFFCILPGIILGVIGLFQSISASKKIKANPDIYHKDDLKKATNGKILSFIGIGLSILFLIITPFLSNNNTDDKLTNNKNEETVTLTEEELAKIDSLEQVKKDSLALEEKLKTKKQIERELASISEGIDFSKYDKTVESLQFEIALFGAWAQVIEEGKAHEDKETQDLAKKLEAKVIQIQKKEFPILRKKYTTIVANKLWEENIDVSSSGTGNKYISFTGGIFANNKNIKDFQVTLSEVLYMFRFSQSRYKWYKGDTEYTYYDMKPPKDSELVKF